MRRNETLYPSNSFGVGAVMIIIIKHKRENFFFPFYFFLSDLTIITTTNTHCMFIAHAPKHKKYSSAALSIYCIEQCWCYRFLFKKREFSTKTRQSCWILISNRCGGDVMMIMLKGYDLLEAVKLTNKVAGSTCRCCFFCEEWNGDSEDFQPLFSFLQKYL